MWTNRIVGPANVFSLQLFSPLFDVWDLDPHRPSPALRSESRNNCGFGFFSPKPPLTAPVSFVKPGRRPLRADRQVSAQVFFLPEWSPFLDRNSVRLRLQSPVLQEGCHPTPRAFDSCQDPVTPFGSPILIRSRTGTVTFSATGKIDGISGAGLFSVETSRSGLFSSVGPLPRTLKQTVKDPFYAGTRGRIGPHVLSFWQGLFSSVHVNLDFSLLGGLSEEVHTSLPFPIGNLDPSSPSTTGRAFPSFLLLRGDVL